MLASSDSINLVDGKYCTKRASQLAIARHRSNVLFYLPLKGALRPFSVRLPGQPTANSAPIALREEVDASTSTSRDREYP